MSSNNVDQTWAQANWRPYAAWIYLIICLFDFTLAPIFLAYYAWITDTTYVMWAPLTLQGGGLVHLSFGALLTATSISKSNERIKKILPNKANTDDK